MLKISRLALSKAQNSLIASSFKGTATVHAKTMKVDLIKLRNKEIM